MFKKTQVAVGVLVALSGAMAVTTASAQSDSRVEVTGSKIKRLDAETSQPIFTLDRADIQAQGLTSIGDVIQNLTANGSTLNSTFNNGGNGETRVSLRNLGSERTLVLINGRRWVGGTGLGGAVDLNTIPAAAVERIEVLKDGASVTYGSDAIAGVVNIILRKDFTGAEANAYMGRFSQGDGKRQAYDITIGASADRFRSLVSVSYVKEDPVMAGEREISAVPVFGTGTLFGSSTTPFGRFTVCNGTFSTVTGTCSGTQTQPNGAAGQFTYSPGQSGNNYRTFLTSGATNDFYNFAPENYLLTPQERKAVFARANYDISNNVQAELQATFNNRRSEQLLASMPIVLGTGPGAGSIARTIAISQYNIYNPFGKDVVRIQRRASETGGRSFNQDVTTQAFGVGLKGTFNMGGRQYSWDAGMMNARNYQSDVTFGLFNLIALRNALGPSMRDATGKPVCVSTPGNLGTLIAGCVPINLLGAKGTITQDMINYTSFEAHDVLGYSMRSTYANLSGDLFKLPGGMASFAAGFESRNESGFDRPDALIATGNTTGNARTPTSGGYGVKEMYGEVQLPLLSKLPMVRSLDLSLATRRSDYTNFGVTTNSKAGVLWKLNTQAAIRANVSQGFRAPSIGELYEGVADSFPQIADPCSNTFGGGYNGLTAEQKARCSAQGVPAGGYDQGNSQIRISVGGNPNLKPEKSRTTTFGVLMNPEAIPGFDISVDYWKIALKDTISSLGGGTILSRCIRDGDQGACALFTRAPGGQITNLLSAGLNFGSTDVEGIDVTMNYVMPKTPIGRVRFNWDTTYMKRYEIDKDGENLVGNYYDRSNFWKIRSNLLTRVENGNWTATLVTRYLSRQVEAAPCELALYGYPGLCSDDANRTNVIPATFYNDAAISWRTPMKSTITFGINNLLNKQPPKAFSTFANSFDPQYEIPGRFMYVRYSQRF